MKESLTGKATHVYFVCDEIELLSQPRVYSHLLLVCGFRFLQRVLSYDVVFDLLRNQLHGIFNIIPGLIRGNVLFCYPLEAEFDQEP